MTKRAQKKRTPTASAFKIEVVELSKLKDHPRNYREHPDDQIEHIIASISEHGFYKNIITAREYTVLGGHGVKKAAIEMGLRKAPIKRLMIDPNSPAALKILAGDNEMGHLAEVDDRALIEIFAELSENGDDGLLGTGYDKQMLAALAFVARPPDEIQEFDEAEHWVGLPEYAPDQKRIRLIVAFDSEADRDQLIEQLKLIIWKKFGLAWSTWWPPKDKQDLSSLRFEDGS